MKRWLWQAREIVRWKVLPAYATARFGRDGRGSNKLIRDTLLDNKRTRRFQLNALLALSEYRVLALLASALCFVALVNAIVPQFQMYLSGGRTLFGDSVIKTALLVAVAVGCVLRPKVKIAAVPWLAWLLCIGYLIVEVIHLTMNCGMSLGEALFSYYNYYCLFLIGPALLNLPRRSFTTNSCTMLCFYFCSLRDAGSRTTSDGEPYLVHRKS